MQRSEAIQFSSNAAVRMLNVQHALFCVLSCETFLLLLDVNYTPEVLSQT